MNAKLFNASLLTACVLLASANPVSASGYTFSDLGTLVGRYDNLATATDINDSGQVVGYGRNESFYHAIIWNDTTATKLPTPAGGWWGWTENEKAYGINNSGQVVGVSLAVNGFDFHATIWNGTTPTDLGAPGGRYSLATGINNSGQVVGVSLGSPTHAIIWNGTTPTVLGDLGGTYSWATGINDSGQVVGSSLTSDRITHATIWNGTTPTDLGTLGGNASEATGINNAGQVVGSSLTSDGITHATIWNGTTPTDLNNFLSVSDVNAGWVLREANGINDNGWLVGAAWNIHTGARDAFLLTPCDTCPIYIHPDPININTGQVPDPVPEVPEPETYALFMAGLGLMGFIARRRKNGQA